MWERVRRKTKAARVAGNIAVVNLFSTGIAVNYGKPPIYMYDPHHTLAGDMFSDRFPVDNQPSSIALAHRFGAVGYVGILTFRDKDNCVEYHGSKDGNGVIPGLTVSPSSGARIKEFLRGGPVEATLVLAEDPGPGRRGGSPS